MPLNVLVLPFRLTASGRVEYAIFRRADDPGDFWQGVAGGVEDAETPLEAARRELFEEAGLSPREGWIALDAQGSVPANVFADSRRWGPDVFIVVEHCFGVELSPDDEIQLSHEHTEVRWLDFETASRLFRYDSNRIALWELNERLSRAADR
jgi:dATP pyrophosphohydrolase